MEAALQGQQSRFHSISFPFSGAMKMNVGEIENVKALVFRSPVGSDHYVVPDEPMDFVEFRERYEDFPSSNEAKHKQCVGANLDDGWPFWAIWVSDCMDPPVVIVRAENEQDALDMAVDEFHFLQVSPDDYGFDEAEWEGAVEEGTVGIADGGNYYDAEQIRVHPIRLYRVEME